LIVVAPTSITIPPDNWAFINLPIAVSALDGNYDFQTNFLVTITSHSHDPKYINLTTSKTIVVTPKVPIVPGLIGTPQDSLAVEESDFQYQVTLSVAPQANDVRIIIISDKDKCKITQPEVFTAANWNQLNVIRITPDEDGDFYAKFSTSYICRITHRFETEDALYTNATSTSFDLTITSSGCGLYENTNRNNDNSSTCICQKGFYLPPGSNCVQCPPRVSMCVASGLTAPPVAPNYWRYDPTSYDIVKYPFYKCPLPSCLGGNSTVGRCKDGHDNILGS
jgi:hypothetical protein